MVALMMDSRQSNFPPGPAAAAAGSGRTAAAAAARGQAGKGSHHDEQAQAARLSRAAGFVDQLEKDICEGFANVSFTRATARALYYAAFDVVHGRTREHDPDDFQRLSIALARLDDAGWPLEEE